MDPGKLTGLVLAGLFFLAGFVLICLPFHVSDVNLNNGPGQTVSCRPAILIGWAGANDASFGPDSGRGYDVVRYACGGPARERLIFGGGIALLVAGAVTAALVLPRRRIRGGITNNPAT